jgi:hypothetical protein
MEAKSAEAGKRWIGDFGEVGDFVDSPEEMFGGRGRKMGVKRHGRHESE